MQALSLINGDGNQNRQVAILVCPNGDVHQSSWLLRACGRQRKVVIGMYQKSAEPRGVFDDFSFVSVAASALTAATSFLLSSKIGLAGSLIGAVVAAAISTAATQVYRGLLVASAERIRYVAETGHMAPSHMHHQHMHHAAPRILGRLVVFAVMISLLGVLASAAFIAFATRGEGLGPTEWEPSATIEETAEELVDEAKEVKDTVKEVASDAAAKASETGAAVETGEGAEATTESTQTTTTDTTTGTNESQVKEVAETPSEPVAVPTEPTAPSEPAAPVVEETGATTQQ